MSSEKRRKPIDNLTQIMGELILYSPLIIVAYFINTLPICLLAMVCIFIFKYFFYYSLHLNKWYYCMLLSYSLFIVLSLLYVGIGVSIPFMDNQPMIIVLVCVGIAYLNHYAGIWQRKLTHKDIYAMTEEELYQHCRNCGLSEDDCKIAYFIVIERLKGKEFYEAINYSERQAKRKRKNILKIIKQ